MFLIDMFNKKTVMPAPGAALPGRAEPIPTSETHFVSGRPLKGPYPDGFKTVLLGMGCFWGAERLLWHDGNGRHRNPLWWCGLRQQLRRRTERRRRHIESRKPHLARGGSVDRVERRGAQHHREGGGQGPEEIKGSHGVFVLRTPGSARHVPWPRW